MSDAEDLTDRDEMVMQAASGGGEGVRPEPSKMDRDELEVEVEALREQVDTIQAEFDQFRQDVTQKINQLENAIEGDVNAVGSTTLEKYASMPPEVREETISPTEQRAVKIYLHWDELFFGRDDKGRRFVDTQTKANLKHNPSRIKVELRDILDEGLESIEIYRALQMVAKLSGSEETTDSYDRLHITGGDFEYHELPVADNSKLRKVLREENE